MKQPCSVSSNNFDKSHKRSRTRSAAPRAGTNLHRRDLRPRVGNLKCAEFQKQETMPKRKKVNCATLKNASARGETSSGSSWNKSTSWKQTFKFKKRHAHVYWGFSTGSEWVKRDLVVCFVSLPPLLPSSSSGGIQIRRMLHWRLRDPLYSLPRQWQLQYWVIMNGKRDRMDKKGEKTSKLNIMTTEESRTDGITISIQNLMWEYNTEMSKNISDYNVPAIEGSGGRGAAHYAFVVAWKMTWLLKKRGGGRHENALFMLIMSLSLQNKEGKKHRNNKWLHMTVFFLFLFSWPEFWLLCINCNSLCLSRTTPCFYPTVTCRVCRVSEGRKDGWMKEGRGCGEDKMRN